MYKKIIGIIICMLLIASGFGTLFGFIKTTKADPGDVINIFDTPGYDCWGVAWNWKANTIWSSGTTEGTMHIFEVDPSDGKILQDLDTRKAGGVGGSYRPFVYDGDYFWARDPYDNVIQKIDPSNGNIIDSFNFLDDVGVSGLSWGWSNNLLYALGTHRQAKNHTR